MTVLKVELESPTQDQEFHMDMAGPTMPVVELRVADNPEVPDLEYRFQVGNPDTGRALEYEDEPTGYIHPTTRALALAMEAVESKKKREGRRKELPANTGRPWTQEEDDWIIQGHDDGATIQEMAESHGRTAGAIRSRLMKLGKLQPHQDTS